METEAWSTNAHTGPSPAAQVSMRRTQTVKIKASQVVKIPSPDFLPPKRKKIHTQLPQIKLTSPQNGLHFKKNELKHEALKMKMDE